MYRYFFRIFCRGRPYFRLTSNLYSWSQVLPYFSDVVMNGNSNNRQFGIRHRIYCVNLRSVKRILQLWGEKHPETYPDHDTLVWLLNNQYRSEAIYFLMEWIIEDINRFYSFRVIVSLTDQNEEIKREIERGQMGQSKLILIHLIAPLKYIKPATAQVGASPKKP